MTKQKKMIFIIRLPYWLGILADSMWAIALFYPPVFGLLTGNPEFNPELEIRLIMGIGGTLMACWTILLIWALRKPIQRRFIILLTALVVLGMALVALIGMMNGNDGNIWILIKCIVLLIIMVVSYFLARDMDHKYY